MVPGEQEDAVEEVVRLDLSEVLRTDIFEQLVLWMTSNIVSSILPF